MMRKLLSLLAALCLTISVTPAAAWPVHGVAAGGSASPIVTPGGTQPAVSTPNSSTLTLTNVSYNTIAQTHYGNPADYGYGLRGFMHWDALQLSELGTPNVNSTVHVGILPHHMPTDVELAAGLDSNVSAIDVSCDGGSTFTITAPSFNPDSGQTDWNFQIQTASWADGLHHCEANGKPATGPNMAAQGPIRDDWGNGYDMAKAVAVRIDNGAVGSNTAGQILTVTSANGRSILNWRGGSPSGGILSVGHSVTMRGSAPNTFIDGTSTTNATSCVAATGSNCTGAGDTGTYHTTVSQSTHGAVFTGSISPVGGVGVLNVTSVTSGAIGYSVLSGVGITAGTYVTGNSTDGSTACGGVACTGNGGTGTYALSASQTVGSEAITTYNSAVFGDQTSFWFYTNYGNTSSSTWSRGKVFVQASTGSDGNSGASSALPVQTIGQALVKLAAQDPRTNQKGVFGGYVCLMGGLSSPVSGSTATAPAAKLGWATFVSANDPHCAVSGDPGGAGIAWTGVAATDNGYLPNHTLNLNINFTGAGSPQTASQSAWYTAAIGVTQKSTKVNFGGLLGTGGFWCSESVTWFGSDGACSGAEMVRGVTGKYAVNSDALHDVSEAVGNAFDGVGTAMEWVRGTMGANNVVTFALQPSELSGYTLAQILDTGSAYNAYNTALSGFCFNGGSPGVGITVSGNTVTFVGATVSGNCANGSTVYLYFDGGHTDNFQIAGLNVFANVYVVNNSFNATYKSGGQGLFLEASSPGLYIAGNSFNLDGTGSLINDNGGNELVVFNANTFGGSGSYRLDWNGASYDETLIKDKCLVGSYPMFVGVGSNIRQRTASATPCYPTAP